MKILKNVKNNIRFISVFLFSFFFLFSLKVGAQTLQNPLNAGSIEELLLDMVGIIVRIGFFAVVIAIIYSGFLFVTAGGKEEQIKKAKTGFFWVVIGSAILLGAEVLVVLIRNTLEDLGIN